MIDAVSLYEDVDFTINKEDNGYFPYSSFNDVSWLGQLMTLDWLTGSLTNVTPPPELISSQKRTDFLSKFVVKLPLQSTGGAIPKPPDYYLFQNLYKINNKIKPDIDDNGQPIYIPDKQIQLLEGSKFNKRIETSIEELKPKYKPVAKLTNQFEFEPKDLGSIVLEYVRYPVRAFIPVKINQYNDEVPDKESNLYTNFEWDEYARPLLKWFIVREFSLRVREQALFVENNNVKP